MFLDLIQKKLVPSSSGFLGSSDYDPSEENQPLLLASDVALLTFVALAAGVAS